VIISFNTSVFDHVYWSS